jgi:hypothetical protein
MRIVSRKSSAAEETSRNERPGRRVHRRIEITVEREIVSVLVRGRQEAGPGEPALDKEGPERILGDLPEPG